jgi:hypothetical protein
VREAHQSAQQAPRGRGQKSKSRHGHAAKDVGARRSFNEYRRIE